MYITADVGSSRQRWEQLPDMEDLLKDCSVKNAALMRLLHKINQRNLKVVGGLHLIAARYDAFSKILNKCLDAYLSENKSICC